MRQILFSKTIRQEYDSAMLGKGEKMAAYRFAGYWKDVGTLGSLWDANMDILSLPAPGWICRMNPGRSLSCAQCFPPTLGQGFPCVALRASTAAV